MDIRQRMRQPHRRHRRPGRRWLAAAALLISASGGVALASWHGGQSTDSASVVSDAVTSSASPVITQTPSITTTPTVASAPASAPASPSASSAPASPTAPAPSAKTGGSAAKSSATGTGSKSGGGSGSSGGSSGSGGSGGSGSQSGASSSDAAQAVLDVINKARAGQGLAALSTLGGLTSSAALHSQTMSGGCGLSHQCSGEAALGQRETAQGVHWSSAGENIGTGGPVNGAQAVADMAVQLTQDMLAEKPPNDGHRRNILSSSFTKIGISVIQDSSGTVWMTQDFSG